jgi:hypothetical protein
MYLATVLSSASELWIECFTLSAGAVPVGGLVDIEDPDDVGIQDVEEHVRSLYVWPCCSPSIRFLV